MMMGGEDVGGEGVAAGNEDTVLHGDGDGDGDGGSSPGSGQG